MTAAPAFQTSLRPRPHPDRARLPAPVHRPGAAGRPRRRGPAHRLHRLRRHRSVAARGQPGADHAAAPVAADRPSRRGADGRRHHAGGRPHRARQLPRHAVGRRDRRQHRRHPPRLRPASELRRPERGPGAQQRRVALRLRLRRVPAPLRHALHGQPHAGLRQRAPTAGARGGHDLPRVQLHADAVGGLPGAPPPPRLQPAARRQRPVGQHRLRRRPRAARGRRRGVRLHHAADHHRLRRQDGQDRRGGRMAERRPPEPVRATGSSGGTRRTPTSAASCACSPICR